MGGGLGAAGAGVGIGIIFGKVIESVTRQPEMRDEITSIQWLGFALTEAVLLLRPRRRPARLLPLGRDARATDNPRGLSGDSGGSFLVKPGVGLMIWTLFVFGVGAADPSQGRLAADRRRARQAPARDRGVDRHRRAHQGRGGALLEEYRERLKEARTQAEEIVARANKAAQVHERESTEEARRKREELMAQARRDIEAETRRAIQEIRREVAELTVMATEKVTRKTLTGDDQERLVKEALDELDFSALAGEAR